MTIFTAISRLLILCALSTLCLAETGQPWTWKDRTGAVRSRSDLDQILAKQRNWIESGNRAGSLADLSNADLHGVDLKGVNLRGANLDHVNLQHAILDRSDLSMAHLNNADLRNASLRAANLNHIQLSHAFLTDSDLTDSNLSAALLDNADLTNANLSRALMVGAKLVSTDLTGSDLSDAILSDAWVRGAIYFPKKPPNAGDIAWASDLGHITWPSNSGAIFALRKSLHEGGYDDAARLVSAAIHRHNQGRWEHIFFDYSCEWGTNAKRPLELAGLFSIFFFLVYCVGLHADAARTALYLVRRRERAVGPKTDEYVSRLNARLWTISGLLSKVGWAKRTKSNPELAIRIMGTVYAPFLVVAGYAFFFSLLSVLKIGYRGMDGARWVRMLWPREFDIRAEGWIRVVAGVQSLLGVVLVALSLLSYFGHLFE